MIYVPRVFPRIKVGILISLQKTPQELEGQLPEGIPSSGAPRCFRLRKSKRQRWIAVTPFIDRMEKSAQKEYEKETEDLPLEKSHFVHKSPRRSYRLPDIPFRNLGIHDSKLPRNIYHVRTSLVANAAISTGIDTRRHRIVFCNSLIFASKPVSESVP